MVNKDRLYGVLKLDFDLVEPRHRECQADPIENES